MPAPQDGLDNKEEIDLDGARLRLSLTFGARAMGADYQRFGDGGDGAVRGLGRTFLGPAACG
jgi:hypothetical protein